MRVVPLEAEDGAGAAVAPVGAAATSPGEVAMVPSCSATVGGDGGGVNPVANGENRSDMQPQQKELEPSKSSS